MLRCPTSKVTRAGEPFDTGPELSFIAAMTAQLATPLANAPKTLGKSRSANYVVIGDLNN
jgi:hypothetical protein